VENSIEEIEAEALQELAAAAGKDEIQDLSVTYLGRKGKLTQFLRNISNLPPDKRPDAGKSANILKKRLEQEFKTAFEKMDSAEAQRVKAIDVSLPGRPVPLGTLHPITQIIREICAIFQKLGFDIAEGPEVESDYYNFEALNIPKNHPARDMQDTFYMSENIVLRTHTSPIQVRYMQAHKPPLRIVAPGKVYRCDSDLTHSPMFHQVEGLWVGETVSFADLKGVIADFLRRFFETDDLQVRFRPSFFPFTEPSAEIDVAFMSGALEGRWLEIAGCGVVHPNVLRFGGIDPERYTGFAFGMGPDRLSLFFEGDLRFLSQFR